MAINTVGQIKRLGERLRESHPITKDDLALLDEFRQTFSDIDKKAYSIIQQALAGSDGWICTKRKRKTQQSIVAKLSRLPKLRLPRMQDIAGCRIVLKSGIEQANNLNNLLLKAFKEQEWQVEDKERNADGYRAIHVIVKLDKNIMKFNCRLMRKISWPI